MIRQFDLEDGEYFELVHEPDFHGIEFKLKNGDKVFIRMKNFDAIDKLMWEFRGL